MRWRLAVAALATSLVAHAAIAQIAQPATPASASAGVASAAPPGCRPARELESSDLFGLWRAEFDGGALGATVLIEQHPEHKGSFSGAINRAGDRARIAGDIEDGEFTLEESANGINISATWTGALEPSSCGQLILGNWQEASGLVVRRFSLRRLPGSR